MDEEDEYRNFMEQMHLTESWNSQSVLLSTISNEIFFTTSQNLEKLFVSVLVDEADMEIHILPQALVVVLPLQNWVIVVQNWRHTLNSSSLQT